MGIEPGVLHGHKGLLQIFGHGGNGDHHAVFNALVFGDKIAVSVINKGCLRLGFQRGQVEVRGSFHISFGDARHRAHQGQAGQQHQHRNNPHHIHRHREDEIRLLGIGLEDTAGMHEFFILLQGVLIYGLFIPEIFVGIAIHRLVIIRGVGVLRGIHLFLLGDFFITGRNLLSVTLLSQSSSPPWAAWRHTFTG